MKSRYIILVLILLLAVAGVGTASAGNPNPGVIPSNGPKYGDLGASWWQWAFSFGADVPYFNTGGPVDISAHQSGNVWFLAGANFGLTEARTGVVPSGTSLFFPVVNFVNDYPCPDPSFQPDPGETLEHFLQRTGNDALDYFVPDPATALSAELDGAPLTDLQIYRATSPLFYFTADLSLQEWDACITGSEQPGVTVGYWLLLAPLAPGTHTLHFAAPSVGQDVTYVLTVTPGR